MSAEALDELLALYEGEAAEAHYDEVVTEREHALQSADLAIAAGAPPALQAAALLHDVGHLLAATGSGVRRAAGVDDGHESIGARHLRRLLPTSVTAPIALHVAAKRYLCAAEPGYLAELSPGSVASLELQGGPMSAPEQAAFLARGHWEDAVRLRRWDDQAKVAGAETRSLRDHAALLGGLLEGG